MGFKLVTFFTCDPDQTNNFIGSFSSETSGQHIYIYICKALNCMGTEEALGNASSIQHCILCWGLVLTNHLDSTWTMEFRYSFSQPVVLGKVSDFRGLGSKISTQPHSLMDKIMFIEKRDWRESSVSKARGKPSDLNSVPEPTEKCQDAGAHL